MTRREAGGEGVESNPGPRLPVSKPETAVLKLELMSWILTTTWKEGTLRRNN